jgi:hypothetical protein
VRDTEGRQVRARARARAREGERERESAREREKRRVGVGRDWGERESTSDRRILSLVATTPSTLSTISLRSSWPLAYACVIVINSGTICISS